jgi:hypothetical protein
VANLKTEKGLLAEMQITKRQGDPAFLFFVNKILSYFINCYLKSNYFGAESGDCPLPFLWRRMYLY